MPTKTQPSRNMTEKAYERLCQMIPGGVNSPVRACLAMQQLPLVAAHGSADLVYDEDGRSYIDYCGSWGALIHGHAHPRIVETAQKRVAMGSSFGMTTSIEGDIAELIIELVDSIEQIRFVSSGTEACMTAVRLARGFTGRDIIIKFNGNYHGHADFFLIKAGSGVMSLSESSSAGIPDDFIKHTISLPYNEIAAVNDLFVAKGERIAAVIIEPIAANMGVVPPTAQFLHELRKLTSKNGSLLIFDEVITGFRVGLGGAQALYGIQPDLTCFGKIMGGGFPAAALGGRKEVMNYLAPLGPVYQAGTLSGNPVAMAAGLQALKMLRVDGFYEELERKTNVIVEPVKEAMRKKEFPMCIQHVGSMMTLFFGLRSVKNMEEGQALDFPLFARFFRYLFERGIYVPPLQQEAWFISSAHNEQHLAYTRDVILEFIKEI